MKVSNLLAAAVVTTTMVAIPLSASASYYPADRQTYQCSTPTNCPGADHVQFNSFTNNPVVGDERAFVAGNLNGEAVSDRLKVKDGDVVTVRMYVHNNADATKMGGEQNTVAKNVTIKAIIPTASQKDTNMIGFISADNASPKTINDTMSVYGDNNFTLSYVAGSAQFTHAADGVHQTTVAVNDSIVANGANLGDINGCFAYSGYVTLKVKVSMPTPPTPPTPTPVQVCRLSDKAVVTINKDQYDSTKYSYDLSLCNNQPPKNNQIQVCRLSDKQVVTINENDFNSSKYSKDLSLCAATTVTTTTPAQPTTLVNTGPGSIAAVFAAAAAFGTAAYSWFQRRQNAR